MTKASRSAAAYKAWETRRANERTKNGGNIPVLDTLSQVIEELHKQRDELDTQISELEGVKDTIKVQSDSLGAALKNVTALHNL